ncbi:MAG: hypothetical protein ACYS8Y_11980 [Planctomycetota bacterium]
MTRNQKVILILMSLALLCICTFILALIPVSPTASINPSQTPTLAINLTPTPLQHRKAGAIVQCRQFIKDRLVSPSSAKFSSEQSYKVNGKPPNYHAVTGIIESLNRLGVPLRSQYRCDLHYLPDNPGVWILDYLDIED